jgi:hypothetical protein
MTIILSNLYQLRVTFLERMMITTAPITFSGSAPIDQLKVAQEWEHTQYITPHSRIDGVLVRHRVSALHTSYA